MAYAHVSDAIPQLAGLSFQPPGSRPIHFGGQNFTHCCLLALNDSLTIRDGNLSYASPSFVAPGVSVAALESSVADGEFPCGTAFSGDLRGAPVVQVPYAWCEARCPGWELSSSGAMQQWIGPLVQFLVPSLAFCTNVPRARKLAVPDVVFRAHPRTLVGFASYWVRLLGALLMMAADTVVWLSVCFAFAGPMLLSAVYEYALDRKVLEFLAPPEGDPPHMPLRLRAQLLLAVVVGNIRMATLEKSDFAMTERHDSVLEDEEKRHHVSARRLVHNSIWKRIMVMVDEYEESRARGDDVGNKAVVSLPTKLKALLNSQASFGSTIGAPILFFVGSFLYTVLDIDNNLGDNDTAHALAFGMWWMVIPYLAIVSCAMLAANSPSTLEGIVYDGANSVRPDRYEPSFWRVQLRKAKSYAFLGAIIKKVEGYNPIETAFEGRFKTEKLWKRGLNKRQWVQEAINEYSASQSVSVPPAACSSSSSSSPGRNCYYNHHHHHQRCDDAGKKNVPVQTLRASLTLDALDCAYVLACTLFLLLAPCVLAFLTSFNTPRAGLSCRSLTYLVYAVSQVCEMALWAWEARLKIRYGARRWSETRTAAKRFCWWGQVFVGFFAIFAAVGGTMMQLLGVYRSCACRVPATYWTRLRDPGAYIILSDNTAADIDAAQRWWTVTGSTAVGIVSIVCALAWWHQRRLRNVFRDEADKIESDEIC
ncbi:hypothetical protein F4809DRAFT_474171 [Biscogniauxia mediterranea]|nr:hypothetical protein F4809DRAFT_474171 [Biscogniauxia mediterranea]